MKTKEVNKLFEEYYEKHKTILTLDGVVEEKDKNILFILKESNTGNSKETGIKEFWFKDVFSMMSKNQNGYFEPSGTPLEGKDKSAQTKYYNCITKIRDELNKNFGKDYGIFYININKEGGGNVSDGKDVKAWLIDKEKRDFLVKQITLLAPNKVVLFSASTIGNEIIDILHSANISDKNIIRARFHPSRYTQRDINELFDGIK